MLMKILILRMDQIIIVCVAIFCSVDERILVATCLLLLLSVWHVLGGSGKLIATCNLKLLILKHSTSGGWRQHGHCDQSAVTQPQ